MRAHWTSKLEDIAKSQLAQGLAWGLNDTAKDAAEEARTGAQKGLNIRKRGLLTLFIRNPTEHKATKTKLSARVMVGGPKSDPARGSILTQQEDTPSKRPFRGNLVAMPSREIYRKVGGKRTIKPGFGLNLFKPFSTPVDGANRTANGKRGSRIEGRKNTFVVFRRGTGLPILLQRYGKAQRATRALWIWVRQTRLTKQLRFTPSVEKAVDTKHVANLGRGITRAIASAKQVTRGGGVTSSRL